MDRLQVLEIADKTLGRPGRMISASKSDYLQRFPEHVVVFNANVCVKGHGKIWFGDLNVTKDEPSLKKLADELGETVYVLREMDGRFENESAPLYDNARAIAIPFGDVVVTP
jgi:hypothetical protein